MQDDEPEACDIRVFSRPLDRPSAEQRRSEIQPAAPLAGQADQIKSAARWEDIAGSAAAKAPAGSAPNERALVDALQEARRQSDLAAVAEKARILRETYPQTESGYQFGAIALREMGRINEAIAVLNAAQPRFADKIWLPLERIWLAYKQGNWEDAALQGHFLRERFPAEIHGWRVGVNMLRKLGDADADTLLDEALGKFPRHDWPLSEALHRAIRLRRPEEVVKQGAALRAAVPQNLFGWLAPATALRELGRLDEAQTLLMEANVRAPDQDGLLAALADLAAQRGRWAAVSRYTENLRRVAPSHDAGWLLGVRSLRLQRRFEEADVLLSGAHAACPGRGWLLSESAALAQARGNLLAALAHWKAVREAMPDLQHGYIGALQCSQTLGRFEYAEVLLQEAAPRFPDAVWLMSHAGWLAHRRGDFEEAMRRWDAMLATHPSEQEGYRGAYLTLRRIGRLTDAERILRQALARFPTARWFWMEWALLAGMHYEYVELDRRWGEAAAALPDDSEIALKHALARSLDLQHENRDWPTTMARLTALHERFPDYIEGWSAHIRSLRLQRELAQAEQLAANCVERMPDEPEIWLQYALVAADQNALDRVIRRLEDAAARFPNHATIQSEYGRALIQVNRLDAAEAQYRQAVERLPSAPDLACGYATVAMHRQDWLDAMRRWQDVQSRFPHDGRAAHGLLDVQAALESGEQGANMARAPIAEADDRSKMFWQFESLGGTGQGCEFGIVQRAGGADPLGLLRWTLIEPEYLIEALNSRFEGIGTPEQTALDFYETDDPEYCYKDLRFKTRMHTFVHKRDMSEDKMFAQTCRRMAFLRRKMIQSLEAAEKIFVYKICERNLASDELERLFKALRRYGDNTLLYVRYADNEHPSGMVEERMEGLLVGYISGFNISPEGRQRSPDLLAWNAICTAAFQLHQARSRPAIPELGS
jgi:tetratricopeptide (TPR) repeat protein